MVLSDDVVNEIKAIWPDRWLSIIEFYSSKDAQHRKVYSSLPDNVKDSLGGIDRWYNELLDRIKSKKEQLQFEQDVCSMIIPKDQLSNGVTYIALDGTEHLSRHVAEATWDSSQGMFIYKRSKFGMEFDDTMHHFTDVVNSGLAGFTPIKEKQ